MAIYGVGAYYDHDVSESFIEQKLVGTGWHANNAPELQEYFKSLKVGDVVYLKASFGGKDIKVKGIGIIRDNEIRTNANSDGLVKIGRNVAWLNTDHFVIPKPAEKNNVRLNTVYEEFHPTVQTQIINRIAYLRG